MSIGSLVRGLTKNQMKRRLLLNIIVGESATVLQLLPRKNEPLLIRWDTLLILDLTLDALDRVALLYIQSNGLAGKRLHEDLHSNISERNILKRSAL